MSVKLMLLTLCCLLLTVNAYPFNWKPDHYYSPYKPHITNNQPNSLTTNSVFQPKTVKNPTPVKIESYSNFDVDFVVQKPCPNLKFKRDRFGNCYDPKQSVDFY